MSGADPAGHGVQGEPGTGQGEARHETAGNGSAPLTPRGRFIEARVQWMHGTARVVFAPGDVLALTEHRADAMCRVYLRGGASFDLAEPYEQVRDVLA